MTDKSILQHVCGTNTAKGLFTGLIDQSEPLKTCTKCGDVKPKTEFFKSATKKIGVQSRCKTCISTLKKDARTAQRKLQPSAISPPDGCKFCTQCGAAKLLSLFHKQPKNSDGVDTKCKDCVAMRNSELSKHRARCRVVHQNFVAVKTCTLCQQTKSTREFSRLKISLDGLDFYCSDCQSQKKHEKSAHNKAVLIANPIQETHKKCSTCKSVKSAMDFYADFRNQDGLCSQCSACMMITTIEWQKKNPDKVKKIGMDWAAANPQKVAAKGKKYRQNHPEVMRIHYQTRRSRKKSCGGKLSKGIVSKLLKLQHGKCACCGSQLVLLPSGKVDGKHVHIDHIMPLAKGGTNTDSNVQLLTSRCNLQKKDRHPVDFMQSRGFLL